MKIDRAKLLAAIPTNCGGYARERVEVPGLDDVFARESSSLEAQQLSRRLMAAKTEQEEVNAMAQNAICVLCDETGAAVLTSEDLPTVMQWPARIIRAITRASNKAGGVSDDAEADAKNE